MKLNNTVRFLLKDKAGQRWFIDAKFPSNTTFFQVIREAAYTYQSIVENKDFFNISGLRPIGFYILSQIKDDGSRFDYDVAHNGEPPAPLAARLKGVRHGD